LIEELVRRRSEDVGCVRFLGVMTAVEQRSGWQDGVPGRIFVRLPGADLAVMIELLGISELHNSFNGLHGKQQTNEASTHIGERLRTVNPLGLGSKEICNV
jgi:hypothetical protein